MTKPHDMALRHKYIGLVKYFNLVKQFTLVQYKLKDQSTFLGLLWSFINPLVMLAILFFAFNKSFGSQIRNYPIYLLLGIVQYNFFVNATSAATTILFSQGYLTRNVIFPKETLVISAILSNTVQFIFEIAVCMALAVFLGAPVTIALLSIPAVVCLEVLMVLWAGLFLSCFHVFVKDVDNLWRIFSRILFFVTPIFFAQDFLSSPFLKVAVFLNPLAYLIKYSRHAIINGDSPLVSSMAVFLLVNSLILFIAYKFFKHNEESFAEYL